MAGSRHIARIHRESRSFRPVAAALDGQIDAPCGSGGNHDHPSAVCDGADATVHCRDGPSTIA